MKWTVLTLGTSQGSNVSESKTIATLVNYPCKKKNVFIWSGVRLQGVPANTFTPIRETYLMIVLLNTQLEFKKYRKF